MATIFLDKQSNNWKLKTIDDEGRDKRYKLRKAKPGEQKTPIPQDVLQLASKFFRLETPEQPALAVQPKTIKAPDDLEDFLDFYLEEHAKVTRPGTYRNAEVLIRQFRQFLKTSPEGPKAIGEVAESHIHGWFQWRLKEPTPTGNPIKPHVVVNMLKRLSGIFTLAIEQKKIDSNPVKVPLSKLRKLHPDPKPEDQTKFVEYEELANLLQEIDEHVVQGKMPADYADLVKVMLSTGLRVQAAIDLDFSWITPDWTIKVPIANDKNKRGYTAMVSKLGQEVVTRRRKNQKTGRVFPEKMLQSTSRRYLLKFGINNHTFRHSFGTALVDEDVTLQTIASLMGHTNVVTTQRYAKVRDKAKQAAVAKLKF